MTTYTLWDGDVHGLSASGDASAYTIGTQFSVSETVGLTGIWFYSAPGQPVLPAECVIYDGDTGAEVSGTLNSSPTWSGVAGSGWVKCSYDGSVSLSSGVHYVVAVYYGGGSAWYSEIGGYWTSGAGGSGITNGPLSSPNSSSSLNGQAPYTSGAGPAFPNGSTSGYDFGVDVEVSDIYVVQSFTLNDGSYSGAFTDPVSIHNTIILVVTDHGSVPSAIVNPLYDGASVDGATEMVWASENLSNEDTYSSTVSKIWILPDVQTSGTTLSVTEDAHESFYTGIFGYEVAGLGSSPVVVQTNRSAGGTGDQIISAADTSADAGNFVIAALVQDGGGGADMPVGDPWTTAGLSGNSSYNSAAAYLVTTEAGQTLTYDGGVGSASNFSGSIAEIAPGGGTPSITGAVSLKKMVLSGASTEKAVSIGSISLKKMVLSGASAEKAVGTGVIKLKKMVLSGEGDAVSEIVVVQEASNASGFPSPITAHNSILFWTTSYGNDGQTSPPPTVDGSVYAGTVKLWEGQSVYDTNALYMGLFLIPDVTEATPTLAQADVTNSTGTLGWHAWELQGAASVLDAVVTVMVRENTADTGEISIGPSGETSFAHELVFLLYGQEFNGPPPPPVPDWSTNQANVFGYYYSAWKDSGASAGVTFSADMGAGSDGWVGVILAIPRASDVAPGSVSGAIKIKKMVLSGSVVSGPSVVTNSLANAVQSVPVQRVLTASDGSGAPYTWSVSSGSLPAGLTLSAAGVISGTPTGTGVSDFDVTASDSDDVVSSAKSLALTVVSAPLSPTGPSSSGGVDTWSFTSAVNSDTALILTACVPDSPDESYPHSFIIGLTNYPDDTYGNGLLAMQSLGLHNTYNATLIYPQFAIPPWYADNPEDGTRLEESFMLQVVAWAKANYATTGTEKVYLIGFSKSGTGGQQIFMRWPDVFAGVASWDSPFSMTDYDGTDPNGTVGGGSADVYGNSDNYKANYVLSSAHLTAWKTASDLGTKNRIWIGGYNAFETDGSDYDSLLTSLGILHTFNQVSESAHNWVSSPGWVAPAIEALLSSSEASSVTGAISLKKMVISGTSHEKAVITGSVKLKKLVLAGAGTEKPAITGTISIKKFVISGTSQEKSVITGSIHLNKMRLHGEEARRKSSNLFVFSPL